MHLIKSKLIVETQRNEILEKKYCDLVKKYNTQGQTIEELHIRIKTAEELKEYMNALLRNQTSQTRQLEEQKRLQEQEMQEKLLDLQSKSEIDKQLFSAIDAEHKQRILTLENQLIQSKHDLEFTQDQLSRVNLSYEQSTNQMKKEIDENKEKIIDLEMELDMLKQNQQNNQTQYYREQLDLQIQVNKSQSIEIENQMKQINQLTQQLQSQKKVNAELVESNSQFAQLIRDANAQEFNLKQQLMKLQDYDQLKETIEKLKVERRELEKENFELKTQLNNLSFELTGANLHIQMLTYKINDGANHEEVAVNMEDKCQELTNELEELRVELSKTITLKDEIQLQKSAIESKCTLYQNQLKEVKQRYSELNDSLQETTTVRLQNIELQSRVHMLNAENERLGQAIKNKAQEVEKLKRSHIQLDTLAAQRQEQVERLMFLEQENARLHQVMKSMAREGSVRKRENMLQDSNKVEVFRAILNNNFRKSQASSPQKLRSKENQ